MKLYKFRPLSDDKDFDRARAILDTGSFWCSRFSELNDPMEGVFTVPNSEAVRRIYDKKNKYKICSFSGEGGFSSPLMWGYYANGFKGLAIEVKVDATHVRSVRYSPAVSDVEILGAKLDIESLLTIKLNSWAHEWEYRFLKETEKNLCRIGEISAVYFGDPYGNVDNRDDVYQDNKHLREYKDLKERLVKVIGKNVNHFTVSIEGDKVLSK